jgi:hypothetical protein
MISALPGRVGFELKDNSSLNFSIEGSDVFLVVFHSKIAILSHTSMIDVWRSLKLNGDLLDALGMQPCHRGLSFPHNILYAGIWLIELSHQLILQDRPWRAYLQNSIKR